MEQEKNTLTVLQVEPGCYPKAVTIGADLHSLQQAVDGTIAATYPFRDPVAVILNDDGKLIGLPLNRALRDEHGQTYDVIAGTFLVAGMGEEDFCSLTPEQLETYEKVFHQPETFIRLNHRLVVVPIPDEALQNNSAEKKIPTMER